MAQIGGRVMIYGGKGALGSKCVSHFKSNNYWVGSIGFNENFEADISIVVNKSDDFETQETKILSSLSTELDGSKLEAIICVAGGWAGGNATKNLIKNSDLMWKQSVWSSLISSSMAAHYLAEDGVLALTGAKVALEATPGMIGYGMAKASVHHLVKCLAGKNSGLPKNAIVVAILPATLDTPMNRKWMANADFSTWTPLEFVTELFHKWAMKKERPVNGSLCQLITKNSVTSIITV